MSSNEDEDCKAIQIIPAPADMRAVYVNDDDTLFRDRVQFMELRSSGRVCFMSSDPSGYFDCPEEASNFLGYEFEPRADADWIAEIAEKRSREAAAELRRRKREEDIPEWKKEKLAFEKEEQSRRWKQQEKDRQARRDRELENERLSWEETKKRISEQKHR